MADPAKKYRSLRRLLSDLCRLTETWVDRSNLPEDDDFELFSQLFLLRQTDHARAVLALGQHHDVSLVVRSMHEGLWQLAWCTEDPDKRAARWKAFVVIHDWRHARADREEMGYVKQPEAREIKRLHDQWHEEFLSGHAKKKRAQGKPIPADPYVKHWTGLSVKEIHEQLGAHAKEYGLIYNQLSDWHHWNTAGFGTVLERQGSHRTFPRHTDSMTTGALVLALRYLWETARIHERFHHVGDGTALVKLRRRLVSVAGKYLQREIA